MDEMIRELFSVIIGVFTMVFFGLALPVFIMKLAKERVDND